MKCQPLHHLKVAFGGRMPSVQYMDDRTEFAACFDVGFEEIGPEPFFRMRDPGVAIAG